MDYETAHFWAKRIMDSYPSPSVVEDFIALDESTFLATQKSEDGMNWRIQIRHAISMPTVPFGKKAIKLAKKTQKRYLDKNGIYSEVIADEASNGSLLMLLKNVYSVSGELEFQALMLDIKLVPQTARMNIEMGF